MRSMKTCSEPGCSGKHEARGLCSRHYKRLARALGEVAPRNREYLKRYGRSDRGRYVALRRAARDKGLGFDVTAEQHEHLLRQPCFYCQGALSPTGHSLDRVDNTRGYLMSNVVPCCGTCNRIKNAALTHDEMAVVMNALLAYRKINRS